MDPNLQQNLVNRSTWIRILYMLLFAFIYSVTEMVIFGIALIQIGFKLITGQTNPRLLALGDGLSRYIYQMMRFFTFVSDELPFPFGPWPGDG